MQVPVVPIGNSRGIRFPKVVLDRLLVKEKMEMEVTEKGIILTPVDSPRTGWAEAFAKMHESEEDALCNIPESQEFDWEW